MATSLDLAHRKLGWPSPEEILRPPGAGPSVFASLAQKRIQVALARLTPDAPPRVGILTYDPGNDATEAPLAIVCEFQKPATQVALRVAHRLAWNFAHSPLLITLEPSLVRAWTCCRHPEEGHDLPAHAEVTEARSGLSSISQQAMRALGWVELLSGEVFRSCDRYFQPAGRVDQMLLSNLKAVRSRLLDSHLDMDICHDLLARVIFTQFLFDRKDSGGQAALNDAMLRRLREQAVLSEEHHGLDTILGSHEEAYRLFRWLNERFNGDLFPGKGDTPQEREDEWQAEMTRVKPEHLRILADFVAGSLDMPSGQRLLWRHYSFDAIPLEFISSVYEEFVDKERRRNLEAAPSTGSEKGRSVQHQTLGVHYTPEHLVDYILDLVLPWASQEFDTAILDPACGSGIFLVRAYQRLIHRWKLAHGGEDVNAPALRDLLTKSIRGVDIDQNAVRVASFSLYLAMCDQIDPKYYWTQVRFPRLRGTQLVAADFFRDDRDGFRTEQDAANYDLVIGNAPWGARSATVHAKRWAQRNPASKWELPNSSVGPLFLAKAAALAKATGQVAMLQPAGTVLFNCQPTAIALRKKLFSSFKVRTVADLSALRFGLFRNAVSPSCIVHLSPTPPDGEPISYVCPKPANTREDDYRLSVDPQDVSLVWPREAVTDVAVWATLSWAGRRDVALIKRLRQEENLEKLESEGLVRTRRGICRGDRKDERPELLQWRILDAESFPSETFLCLDPSKLGLNEDPCVHSRDSKDMSAFRLPQLVIKEGWQKDVGRFRCVKVAANTRDGAILCSRSYISVNVSDGLPSLGDATCLSYNSMLGVYFLFLTSGRFASYRPEPAKEELLRVPLIPAQKGMLDEIKCWADIDARVRQGFSLNDAEWALVTDLFQYTLQDFKNPDESRARGSTRLRSAAQAGAQTEPVLYDYCDYLLRVMRAGFGEDKRLSASIFQEADGRALPMRLVGIHLNFPASPSISVEPLASTVLRGRLLRLHRRFLRTRPAGWTSVASQRVARIYTTSRISGRRGVSVFLLKPDQARYWTRSMALRDADELAADIMLWREESLHAPGHPGRDRGA